MGKCPFPATCARFFTNCPHKGPKPKIMAKNKQITVYQRDRLNYYRALNDAYSAMEEAVGKFEMAEMLGDSLESNYGEKFEADDGLRQTREQMEGDLDEMKKALVCEARVIRRMGLFKKTK